MLGIFLILALRQAKHVTSLFNYHLYGDDLQESRFSGSLIASNASLSGAFVLILYYGFLYGPWAFPFVWLFWLITQLTSTWTINRTQEVMERYGGWANNRATLHEFLGLVYRSPRARLYGGVLSLCAYLGLIAAEIVLATHVLAYLFPDSARVPFTNLSLAPFMVIVAVMLSILIYNVLSGFRGTVQTDFAQWLIMSAMILIIAVFVVAEWPVWGSKYSAVFNAPTSSIASALFNPDKQGYMLYISFCISNIIFWGLWWPGAMDQWQRCAAARTRQLSLHPVWGTIGILPIAYFGILTFIFLAAGVWIRVNTTEEIPNPDFLRVLITNVQQWTSSNVGVIAGLLFGAVVFWGLLCAAMSTIDSYVMTASQSFFVDIAHHKEGSTLVELSAGDTEKKRLQQARAFTIFIPLIVIALAWIFAFVSDVYALIYFSFSFMFALLPPLFAGLKGWADEDARRACEYSLLIGGISSVIGFAIIIIKLEAALKANDAAATFYWYQFVYWWPTAVTVIGTVVLWLAWPKRKRAAEGRT